MECLVCDVQLDSPDTRPREAEWRATLIGETVYMPHAAVVTLVASKNRCTRLPSVVCEDDARCPLVITLATPTPASGGMP
jgi:hypothetical protein